MSRFKTARGSREGKVSLVNFGGVDHQPAPRLPIVVRNANARPHMLGFVVTVQLFLGGHACLTARVVCLTCSRDPRFQTAPVDRPRYSYLLFDCRMRCSLPCRAIRGSRCLDAPDTLMVGIAIHQSVIPAASLTWCMLQPLLTADCDCVMNGNQVRESGTRHCTNAGTVRRCRR